MLITECRLHGADCRCYKKGADDYEEAILIRIVGHLSAARGERESLECGDDCVCCNIIRLITQAYAEIAVPLDPPPTQ